MTNQYLRIITMILLYALTAAGSGYAEIKSERTRRGDLKDRRIELDNLDAQYRQQRSSDGYISAASDVDDYVWMGLTHNAGLKGEFYKWKSSVHHVAEVFALPDPQLSFSDYLESVETRVGPQNNAFSIQQRFSMFDKLWIQKSIAFRDSEVAYYSFEKKRLELVFQITDAYYEYVYLRKAILLTQENMKLLSNFESVAQKRYASGLQKNQDLLKIQVELGKLENELFSLEDLRTSLVARLNALLNRPPSTKLPWPDATLDDVDMKDEFQDMDQLRESLMATNPQLLSMDEQIAKSTDAVKLSKRQYIPDVTVGFTRINTGDAINSSSTDSGKDAEVIMFSVNVPIWFKRIKAGVEQAEATLIAAESTRLDQENQLLSKLALVKYKIRDAVRQSKLYKDALIPKAVQTLNATKSGYESGNVDFLSLIDSQRMLLSFQLAYYRQVANYIQRTAELNALIGDMTYFQKGEMDHVR